MPTLPLPDLYLLRSKRSGRLFAMDHATGDFVDEIPADFNPDTCLPAMFGRGEVFDTDHRWAAPWTLLKQHTPDEVEVVRVTCVGQPLTC